MQLELTPEWRDRLESARPTGRITVKLITGVATCHELGVEYPQWVGAELVALNDEQRTRLNGYVAGELCLRKLQLDDGDLA